MIKSFALAAAVLLSAGAANAAACEYNCDGHPIPHPSNGVSTNGLGSNGLGSNGLGQNSLTANSLTSNSLTSNSLTSNSLTTNALTTNSTARTAVHERRVVTFAVTAVTLQSGERITTTK